MTLTHETNLTFEYPSGRTGNTTWGQFATVNIDDPDMLSDVREQFAKHNHAWIGGGAAPAIHIRPAA